MRVILLSMAIVSSAAAIGYWIATFGVYVVPSIF